MSAALPCVRLASRPPIISPVTRGLATSADLCCDAAAKSAPVPHAVATYKKHPLKTSICSGMIHPTTSSNYAWASGMLDIQELVTDPKNAMTKRSETLFYCSLLVVSLGSDNALMRREYFHKVLLLCLQHHQKFSSRFMVNVRCPILSALACDRTLLGDRQVLEMFEELFCTDILGIFKPIPTRGRVSEWATGTLLKESPRERALVPPDTLAKMVGLWQRLSSSASGDMKYYFQLRPLLLREALLLSPFLSEQQFAHHYSALFVGIEDDCDLFRTTQRSRLATVPPSAFHTMVKAWCAVEPRCCVGGRDTLLPENLKVVVDAVLKALVHSGCNLSAATFQLVLDACWESRNRKLALTMYRCMRDMAVQPSVHAFGQITRLSMSSPVTVKWLWEDVCREFRGCPPLGMLHYLMEALAFQNKDPSVIEHVHKLIISRARRLQEPYSVGLYSAPTLLWSFYAATVTGSVQHAARQLDVMVSKGVLPDIKVLSLMWRMVRSRQGAVDVVKAVSERMVRWRIEPSQEFMLEGVAALGQLSDPLYWKSKVWRADWLRIDLLTSAPASGPEQSATCMNHMASAQSEGEARLVAILLAICQQINTEIASADSAYTGTRLDKVTRVSVDDLCLDPQFFLSSSARPGTDEEQLTDTMRCMIESSISGDVAPLFTDSSMESCLETLIQLATDHHATVTTDSRNLDPDLDALQVDAQSAD
eukprot:scpid48247/ scgid5406/ 